uniref:Fungal lipase-like domain-containing protein n=1 Tax=Acrobeloides nanus TaxID=290746 RepID=A0A914DFU9_9BILA
MVSVCSDMKDCASCAESYIHVFSFKEDCRWCVKDGTCGGPFSCTQGEPTAQRDPFKCPTPFPNAKGRRYTDKLGRSIYSLVLAANAQDPTECLKNSRPDVQLIKRYEVECDGAHNTCAGMLAVSDEAKAVYVVYKGSSVDKQLFQEFVHGVAAQLGAWEKFVDGSGVMTYFYSAFTKLFTTGGMKKELLNLKKKYEGYRIWITGHSLGGSLASMTALYLVNQTIFPADKVRLVTFGEPRTGNYLYAKAIEKNLEFRYRVVNKNDFVTNIPGSLDPDNRILPVASSEKQPYYYRFLVHYEDGMHRGAEPELCEYAEDNYCRNLGMTLDTNDHTTYFGVNGEQFLKDKCPKSAIL